MIFLGGLKKVSVSQLESAINNLDETILTENRSKMILSFLPSLDEENLIKQHRGDRSKLRKAERFMMAVRTFEEKQSDLVALKSA